ncbi:hypothetical protein HER39_08735, partial [Arthrobacter deserti]|nr:hypothetical protein [Arthrobacter deserti]
MAENIGAASAQPEPDYDPGIPHGQSEASLRTLIARMEQEMAELQFERFAAADALALGLLLVELGTERSLPIAIDISRDEHELFHVSLAGATADNGIWARAKSRTAARYAEPSLLVGLRARLQGQRMEDNP